MPASTLTPTHLPAEVVTRAQVDYHDLPGDADRFAVITLDEQVVAGPQGVDVCLMAGAGWPAYLGGITLYLDRTGTSEWVTGQRFLPPGVASVPDTGTKAPADKGVAR